MRPIRKGRGRGQKGAEEVRKGRKERTSGEGRVSRKRKNGKRGWM